VTHLLSSSKALPVLTNIGEKQKSTSPC